MAYKITDSCLKCGTCAGECPMNAISEGEDQYVIDADTCVGCGTCLPRSGYCRGVRRSYTITSGIRRSPSAVCSTEARAELRNVIYGTGLCSLAQTGF